MPIVMNCTQENQSFKVFGNWFSLKPGQRKVIDEDKTRFIAEFRKDQGLAVLGPEFEDPEYEKSEAGKAALAELKQSAIDSYVRFHREIVYNNQVSLRQDLEKANIKVDPAIYASEGELESMEIVAKYQASKNDSEQKKADRVKDLMKQIGSTK